MHFKTGVDSTDALFYHQNATAMIVKLLNKNVT